MTRTPKYRLHKPSGRAVVTLAGKQHYLGKYNSVESKREYHRILAEYHAAAGQICFGTDPDEVTLAMLMVDYLAHCKRHYPSQASPETNQVKLSYAMNVTDLDIDLIDRINPFSEAYAVLAKSMSESSLKQVAEIITAKKVQMSPEEARDLAKRALKFKQERGRLPSLTSPDAWEKRMAEGVAYLQRMKSESANG